MFKGKIGLRKKLYIFLTFFCILIILSWSIFYLRTVKNLKAVSENYVTQIADRGVSAVENMFLALEDGGEILMAEGGIKELLKERDLLLYQKKYATVKEIVSAICYNERSIDEILIYSNNGNYSLFRDSLSDREVMEISNIVAPAEKPSIITINALGKRYIGCAVGMYDEKISLGYALLLINGHEMEALFDRYAPISGITLGLLENHSLVASNDGGLAGKSEIDLKKHGTYISRQIGDTGFSICVVDDGNLQKSTQISFLVAVIATILTLLLMLWFIYRFINKLFFKPMMGIVQNARVIGSSMSGKKLEKTGEPEFDILVEQINSMVSRIDDSSRELFKMQYKVQNAEIEKQQAILFSLKKQINAHFTVNTLNVVKRLNETGESQKAGAICDGLSSLLRYANGADEYISCREELYVLREFANIMLIRYPNRFIVEFDDEDELDDAFIPRMLVQPIVENAITHGLLWTNEGKLNISAKLDGESLIITVSDNGKGMDEASLGQLRKKLDKAHAKPWGEEGLENIALPNIQKRINAMFGSGYGLSVESEIGKGTSVTLVLPAHPDDAFSRGKIR